MSRALLGLGANLGDPVETFRLAIDALNALPRTRVTRLSCLYETAPIGYTDQPDFFNLVVELDTTLSPHALLGGCLGIEAALGRRRSFPNAPRVVDIDLLLYDEVVCHDTDLILPHPRMWERRFVLAPLSDLFPQKKIGEMDFSLALEQVSDQEICLSTQKITL